MSDDPLRRALDQYARGDLPQALASIDRVLARMPRSEDAWNAKGVFLRMSGRLEESVACYKRAIEIAPDSAGAWSNLGNSFKDLGHIHGSVACHRKAIELRGDNPVSQHNLGVALAAMNRHREAITAFNRALFYKPNDAQYRWDRGLSALAMGDLAAGWVDYEVRLGNGMLPDRAYPGRRWMGNPYRGQRLLVTAEQGFGDAIWASRFLSRVKANGGTLLLECQPELRPLLAGLEAVDAFVPKGGPLPDAEWHCALCSLPGFFTPGLSAVDGKAYLNAPATRGEHIRQAVSRSGAGFRVGIVWSGSTTFKGNASRAARLEQFVRAFSFPNVRLYSLQKGPPAAEMATCRDGRVNDLSALLGDFADTAAAVAAMDLVVMTDSAVAHLCGALGVPVWVLLCHSPYWLWRQETDRSPWYDSVRLFRQQAPGDWNSVFDRAAASLLEHAGLRS